MPATPRKRPGEATLQTPSPDAKKKRTDEGLWKDGAWFCNCEPARQAVLREVKKAGRNQGKLFWTCNSYPFCDFFLWRDRAKKREVGPPSAAAAARNGDEDEASLRNAAPALTQSALTAYGYQVTPKGRSSAAGLKVEPLAGELSSDADQDLTSKPHSAAAPALLETPSGGPSKRKRNAFEVATTTAVAAADAEDGEDDDDDDDDEFSDLDSDQERQLITIADTSARKPPAVYATPSSTHTHDVIGGLPTPSVSRTLFPDAKRRKHVSFPSAPSAPLPPGTPAPAPALAPAPAPNSSPPDASYDVSDQVMTLLRGQKVDAGVLAEVQTLLTTAARKTKGIALGRESARAGLRAKDEKIAALQERIVALENKERMFHRRMTNVKADLMRMYEEN